MLRDQHGLELAQNRGSTKIPYSCFCTLLINKTVLILPLVKDIGLYFVAIFDSYNSTAQLWKKKYHVLYVEVNFSLFSCCHLLLT